MKNTGNRNNGSHPFAKFFKSVLGQKNNSGRRKEKRNRNNKQNQKNGKSYPMDYCTRCGKFRKKEKHHIFPVWLFNLLVILGLISSEQTNTDVVSLCPRCHNEMELINRKFAAARMRDSKEALAEIFQKFLNRQHISDKYIVYMAESECNSHCSLGDIAVITQKEKEKAES